MLSRKCRNRILSKKWILLIVLCYIIYGMFWANVNVNSFDTTDNREKSKAMDMEKRIQPEQHKTERQVKPKVPKTENLVKPEVQNKLVQPHVQYIDQAHKCSQWFNATFDENLHVISQYPRGNIDTYLSKIGWHFTEPKQMMTSFPVIATAANSGKYYGVVQGLLQSIHTLLLPKYGPIKIVVYDLGLTLQQVQKLSKYGKCEVRKFPFDELPSHMQKLKTCSWKAIIVQTLLMEFGWVWWMDSSVRIITPDLDRALEYSRQNSVLFFTNDVTLSVAQNTDIQTMEYLHEDRCKYRHFGELEAGFVLYHFDHVTKIVVNAWSACALNSECICPPGTLTKFHCSQANKNDGRCHRFDQSILSIIMRRLYHDINDYPMVDIPFHIHVVKRGHRVSYFP